MKYAYSDVWREPVHALLGRYSYRAVFGFGTARLGEWRLNHIHSINGAEDINASCSDSSAGIDYSTSHVDH